MYGTELDLFGKTKLQTFERWVHTPFGGWVADKFIHLALRSYRDNFRQGGRGIWEDVREMVNNERYRGFPPPPDGKSRMNDALYPYMVSFAVQRCPELGNYFTMKKRGERKARRAIIIPIKEPAAAVAG